MDYDVGDLLENLFGGATTALPTVHHARMPEAPDALASSLLVPAIADWVYRPDSHGNMGLEAADLPEWQRWWARCDFDDMPELLPGIWLSLDGKAGPLRRPR